MISEVYNCDCLEYMKSLPDKYFDLTIADPPYGIGISGQKECVCKNPKHNRKFHIEKGWDKIIPSKSVFAEMQRVSKNLIIWGANYFLEHLNEAHKGWICWYKGQQGLTMSDCELDKDYYEAQEVRFRRECLGEITTPQGTTIINQTLF